MTVSRLLILAGSDETATSAAGRRAALDHFDGAAFRIVRKYLADAAPIVAEGLHVMVLTATGLVGAYDRVEPTLAGIGDDQAAMLQLSPRNTKLLHDALDGADSVFVLCSADIEDSLGTMMMSRHAGSVDWMRTEVARGSDARKLNGLLRWLVRTSPKAEERVEMISNAVLAVECATDRPLSPAALEAIDGYMAELSSARNELTARRALAGVA